MIDDPRLDPEMASALRRMEEIAGGLGLGDPPWPPVPVEARRRMEAERHWWNQDLPAVDAVAETAVPGPQGDVPVRLIFPTAARPAPALVYCHGGGWVVGSLETHRRAMYCLALATGAAVVAVDYRLAPEHPFPAGLNDCIAVVSHVADRGAAFGLDPARIAIAGDSAGANLALATALALSRAGDSPIRSVASFYGAFDPACDSPSCAEFADGRYGLSAAGMRWYWERYAAAPEDVSNPLFAPLSARLAGLPPTHVFAAELDVLRDDSARLAERLRDAGVPGEHKVYDGVVHAFMNTTRMVSRAHALIDDAAAAIRRDLAIGAV